MLRLTANNKSRVSNGLAMLAALMLIISVTAGMNDPVGGKEENGSALAGTVLIGDGLEELKATSDASVTKKKKGFKVSLYLFRAN